MPVDVDGRATYGRAAPHVFELVSEGSAKGAPTGERTTKRCCRCREAKSPQGFPRKSAASDGLSSWCRACKAAWSHERFLRHKDRMRQLKRRWRGQNRERRNAYEAAWRASHQESVKASRDRWNARRCRTDQKEIARRAVKLAVAAGELVRQPCEVCGAFPTDGHHPDYFKPLDVRWLCRKHHGAEHRTFDDNGEPLPNRLERAGEAS